MSKFVRKTVTIGICAYNESANIVSLLDSLTAQEKSGEFVIERIIVVSDGSTDDMERHVIHYPDSRVNLKFFPTREGKPTRMNYLMKHATSDILVFLDADVLLENTTTIQNLVRPLIYDKRVGLVGGRCQPLPAETFIEQAVNNYVDARIAVEDLIDFSQTAYSIRGAAMAISRKFAQEIVLPQTILSDDGYFYFYAKTRNYEVRYAKHAVCLYRSPQTVKDGLRQAMRHHAGTPQLCEFFPKEMIDVGYRLPTRVLLRIGFYQLISNPIGYVVVKCINYVAQKEGVYRYQNHSVRWNTIDSSKITKKFV